jgi:hypothetical protein
MPLIQIQNVRGLAPLFLECALSGVGWLAHGWLGRDAPASYSSAVKIHELLLMSSPPWLLKSSWIPNNSLELSLCSISLLLLLLLLLLAAALAVSLLLSFSLLAVSCDLHHQLPDLIDHLVQLLQWLALFMQSPLLQILSANG